MKYLRLALLLANTGAIAVLLAIPIGKVFHTVKAEMDAAAVFGWLIFFVPMFASALALAGLRFSRPVLTRRSVAIAMPGSFLGAWLALFTYLRGPANFVLIGIGLTILFGCNVLALWDPFKDCVRSAAGNSLSSKEDHKNDER